MPELPEVEIVVRRLGAALADARIEGAAAPGVVTMRTFDPPLDDLVGRRITGTRRAGKMPILVFDEELALLVHLMSAGRLGVFEGRASVRDRRVRLRLSLEGEREVRLREFGTQQRAWAKLLPLEGLEADDAVAKLGPEAWPPPPLEQFAALVREPRHLHPLLRDQRTIAGIGRSWVDEILWTARLSPFRQGADLDDDAVEALHTACDKILGGALEHYERVVGESLPDKAPMPLQVHARQGEPCPRCGATLEAVFFKDHVTTYCPQEQTGGRVLKDRRLSRLLR
jgi:formamidopyrimidine-DNA glycosylase